MPYQLPKDGAIYSNSIFGRCRDLIGYGVWAGIEPHRLNQWIANFKTAEEVYFAAHVLDAMIYRSQSQTVALMRHLFHRSIPDLARLAGLAPSLRVVFRALQDVSVDPGVRIVPVIPTKGPPTKSGSTIARMLKRHLGLAEKWMMHPSQLLAEVDKVKAFIFVDDFLGTGDQFSTFLSETGIDGHLNRSCYIYATLAGHRTGVGRLQHDYPALHLATVELLDRSHALFNDDAGADANNANSAADSREFYYELLENRAIELDGPDRRGYGHFELAYAFEHAVSDNSLPILWWNKSTDWQPLFDR
jgi:hypothetical protein